MGKTDFDSGEVDGSCALRHKTLARIDQRLRSVEEVLPNFDSLFESLAKLHADNKGTRDVALASHEAAIRARNAATMAANKAAEVSAGQLKLTERVEEMQSELIRELVGAVERRANDADRSRDSFAQIALADRAGERDVRKERLKITGAVLLGLIGIASAYVAGRSHTQVSPAPITAPAK